MTCLALRSTTLQNFITLRQPTPEISVTKNPADRKTVNDISPTCLLARGDNKRNACLGLHKDILTVRAGRKAMTRNLLEQTELLKYCSSANYVQQEDNTEKPLKKDVHGGEQKEIVLIIPGQDLDWAV